MRAFLMFLKMRQKALNSLTLGWGEGGSLLAKGYFRGLSMMHPLQGSCPQERVKTVCAWGVSGGTMCAPQGSVDFC